MKRLLLPFLLAAILLSACGSSNSAKNENTTTSTSTVNSADQALAKKMVVTSDDLPGGWTASSTGTSSNNLAGGVYDQLSTCLGAPTATANRTVLFSGNSYADNSNAISSAVSGFKTAAIVTTEVAGIKNSANYPCITNLFDTFVGQLAGGAGGAAPSSALAPVSGLTLGDNQFALRVTTTLTTGETKQTIYSDLIGVGGDRFVATASINFFNTAPPATLESQVLDALTAHVALATAS